MSRRPHRAGPPSSLRMEHRKDTGRVPMKRNQEAIRVSAWSRREFLNGTLGGAISAAFLPCASGAEARSIKAVAAEKGILFGSSVGAGRAGTLTGSFADPRYLAILKEDCSVLVPENELKSYVIAAERGRYNFE